MTLFLNTHHSMVKDFAPASQLLTTIKHQPKPPFAEHEPALDKFFELAGKYGRIKNFIIVGRGGAITSFKTIFHALGEPYTTKKLFFLDTNDPAYIRYLKKHCLPSETLIVVISKSGSTTDVIENFLSMQEYEKLIITGTHQSPLKRIQEVRGLEYAEHPPIGGRFSAITASTLLPSALLFIDAKELAAGMKSMFERCAPDKEIGENPALELATTLYLLEERDVTDIFVPLYGFQLRGFDELVTQLMHETVCKEGRGQNILASSAPESQHHTNQRVFGGRRNLVIIPHIARGTAHDVTVEVPHDFQHIPIRDADLSVLDHESLQRALLYEFDGVCEEATAQHIPLVTVMLDKITPFSIGELLGFWQYVAVYSAMLRGVNPFDQPEVEASKKRSFDHRKLNARVNGNGNGDGKGNGDGAR